MIVESCLMSIASNLPSKYQVRNWHDISWGRPPHMLRVSACSQSKLATAEHNNEKYVDIIQLEFVSDATFMETDWDLLRYAQVFEVNHIEQFISRHMIYFVVDVRSLTFLDARFEATLVFIC